MDELELRRENAGIDDQARDHAVDDFIELVDVDGGILQAPAEADAEYFFVVNKRSLSAQEHQMLQAAFHNAYRWQYVLSGASHPHIQEVLLEMITTARKERALAAVTSLA